jgi:arylsulfatase A-like enzyme
MHQRTLWFAGSAWVCALGVVLAAALAFPALAAGAGRGQAQHVVVMVWDGMRPDFVTPQYTPTLWALAREGVFFKNHHPVFPSSTEVNGTALATGAYPNHSGIMANNDYRPELSFMGSIATEGLDNIRRADLLTGGRYLLYPTLAETIQQAGYPTIVAGTKPVVILHDRWAKRRTEAQADSAVVFAGQTIPKALLKQLEEGAGGKFPTYNSTPNTEKDTWTTRAVIEGLWKTGVPMYTLIWLYDPDSTQHAEGVGSNPALAAIASADKRLKEVLKVLDEKHLRDKTDILVTSDHGFSNIKRGPDVVEALKKADFKAVRRFEDPEPGEILVVGHGGATSFYVVDHDEQVVRDLVEFLQGTDFTGVIFSRVPAEGTFPMEAVRINTTKVEPDVVISLRWTDEAGEWGAPGLVMSDGGAKGQGMHGSLSRYDMHNTLVAAGPDFKKGMVDEVPSGGIDIAPTVLWILGIAPLKALDGRVLHEALAGSRARAPWPRTSTIRASRDIGWFRWQQYLKSTQVGQTIYFDEGNGGMTAK